MKRTRSLILVINLCLFCKLCAQNPVTEIETKVAAVRYAQLFLQYKESCEEMRATGETSDLVGGGNDTPADTLAGPKALHTETTDIPADAALSVYPNPAGDLLHIELSGVVGIASVALYDLQGRMVTGAGAHAGTPQQGGTATVNLRNVPAGVYLLRVRDAEGKEYMRKIVKK